MRASKAVMEAGDAHHGRGGHAGNISKRAQGGFGLGSGDGGGVNPSTILAARLSGSVGWGKELEGENGRMRNLGGSTVISTRGGDKNELMPMCKLHPGSRPES